MTNTVIHIISPALFAQSIKRNVSDGEIWTLRDRLSAAGFSAKLYDGYLLKTNPLPAVATQIVASDNNILIVHLWKADSYGVELNAVIDSLYEFRSEYPNIFVIAFGYIAYSALSELNHHAVAIDAVVAATGVYQLNKPTMDATKQSIANLVCKHLRGRLDDHPLVETVREQNANITETTIVSLHASRGCRARCSFCAYNSDLNPGWVPRPTGSVATEIEAVLRSTPTRRIAFYDNDFGGSADSLTLRARELHSLLGEKGLLNKASIAINVRSDCLTSDNIVILREIGVQTMLIGVESFNSETRQRIFHKRVDEGQLRAALDVCDRIGIQVLLSYILWHPWQTIEGLQAEVSQIIKWGRYRVPQFLSRSVLQVIPGTPIEKRLSDEDLLSTAYLDRRFSFVEPRVTGLFKDLREWLDQALGQLARRKRSPQESLEDLTELKMAELDMYREVFHLPIIEPTCIIDAEQ